MKLKYHFIFGALLLSFLGGQSVLAQTITEFKDVSRVSPYFLAVRYWNSLSVIKGYEDGTFKPDQPINRAETLKIILTSVTVTIPKEVGDLPFTDVKKEDWFAPYVVAAYKKEIISGNDQDKSFAADRQVNKAEFLKMLLIANQVNLEPFKNQETGFQDAPQEAWFAPYIHYAASLGIIASDQSDLIKPAQPLSRGEVMEIMYRLTLIKKGTDTQFLLDQTEEHLKQIEIYIAANQVGLAKKTSKLAVDLSQQALKNKPENNIVLGVAKLARAYDFLVDAFDAGSRKEFEKAAEMANKAIDKAAEAWEANSATQPVARHIKDRAREILSQVGGKEE